MNTLLSTLSTFKYAVLLAITLGVLGGCEKNNHPNAVISPDGTIVVMVQLNEDGQPYYTVHHGKQDVMEKSPLGVKRRDTDLASGLQVVSSTVMEPVEDQYTLLHGKQKEFDYKANRKVFTFENDDGYRMEIIFQVSNDGIGFRYYFPGSSDSVKTITEEVTGFHLPDTARGFLTHMMNSKTGFARTNPSYEEHYRQGIDVDVSAPYEAGWSFPALFKINESWALITETGLDRSYCGTRLRQHSPGGLYRIGFPQETENVFGDPVLPNDTLPYHSPWRVITIGSLETIVESSLGTDLAKPSVVEDTSWIEPGRSSWSWVMLKDDSTIYRVQQRFVDFASKMGWEYTLVDASWDQNIGYTRIEDLAEYAETKGVDLQLWYNSAGDWNDTPYTPKDKMLTHKRRTAEFERITNMGIHSIKVDFFAGDGQSVIDYYLDMIEDAAAHKVMLNFHGSTLPRGWQRTYPHLMTMESVRGLEFATFNQENEDKLANHATVLPFTRNVFDPMDFTPTTFSRIPNIKRKSTNALQLAMPVVFLSGIQHYGVTPKSMKKQPDYVKKLMKKIPVSWDETQFVSGYPGDHVVIARRKGDAWFVGGMNGDSTHKYLELKMPFIDQKEGYIVTDEGGDIWSFDKRSVKLTNDKVEVDINVNSGFVMVFE